MLNKLSPMAKISVPISLIGGYIIYGTSRIMVADPSSYPLNHVFGLLSGLAFWIGASAITDYYGMSYLGIRTHSMGPKVIQWLLPIFAALTGTITLAYGFFLGLSEVSPNEGTSSAILITSLAVVWFGADILLYRNQRIVRNGWIAIVDGRIYHPGERFRLKYLVKQDIDFATDTVSGSN